jgi:hypothetical protein
MISLILAIAILRNDGQVTQTETQHRVEHHHYYGGVNNNKYDSSFSSRDRMDQLDGDVERAERNMYQQDTIRILKKGSR